MKRAFLCLLAVLLCAGMAARAEGYQILMDAGEQAYEENGVRLAVLAGTFPQVIALSDSAAMDRVNRAIQSFIQRDGGFDTVCEYALEDYTDDPSGFADKRYGLEAEAVATLTGDRMLAVRYTFTAYTEGPHPWTDMRAEHYDLGSGDVLPLSDLFADPASVRTIVVDEVLRQIRNGGFVSARDYFDEYEDAVRAWPFEQGFLTDEGLEVFFNAEELGPVSSGLQTFVIDYALLDGLWGVLGDPRG